MELVEIEGNLSACRSRIAALKAETKSCIGWIDAEGKPHVTDPDRLKALNGEIERPER